MELEARREAASVAEREKQELEARVVELGAGLQKARGKEAKLKEICD